MNKKKYSYLTAIVVVLALGFTALAIAKNDNAKNNNASKSDKSSQSQAKAISEKVNLKNFEKPDKTTGKTNAQVHKEKTQTLVNNLHQVAVREENQGNPEVSDDVNQVAQQQQSIQTQTTQAIQKVETRSKIKTFLFGTDYKNLGQLRSSLVQNRNQIRMLTQTMAQVQNTEDATLLQQQLEILMQERERIKNIITTNQDSFSLFGWVSRFLFNYNMTPINKPEEDQLTQDVEDAINNTPTDQEESDDSTDSTTKPATTDTSTP
jgi:hypothetical protein